MFIVGNIYFKYWDFKKKNVIVFLRNIFVLILTNYSIL